MTYNKIGKYFVIALFGFAVGILLAVFVMSSRHDKMIQAKNTKIKMAVQAILIQQYLVDTKTQSGKYYGYLSEELLEMHLSRMGVRIVVRDDGKCLYYDDLCIGFIDSHKIFHPNVFPT